MKDGLAAFIYRTILKPAPLRWLANQVLLLLIPKTITIPEGTLSLNPNDPVISGALALGVYETFEMELFRDILTEGMTVLDIGANIGIYSVIAAKHVGQTGKVLACEPEPVNFSILKHNIEQNGFTNVVAYDRAIADKEGTMELHLSKTNKGHHSLVGGDSNDFSSFISVPVITGDMLLAEAHIEKIDVMKIDIEGAEPLALAGLEKTLELFDLTLFFEFSPKTIQDSGFEPEHLLVSLNEKGFEIYEIQEHKKKLSRIEDAHTFAKHFSGAQYANLLCIKNPKIAARVGHHITLLAA
jgi:FkbM family methyltransferase